MSANNQLPYSEGDVFVLPLRDGGFARGVIARTSGAGVAFGYFFGPRLRHASEARMDGGLAAGSAILVGKFGDLGLLNGSWTVFDRVAPWVREDWPMSWLGRYEAGASEGFRSLYDEATFRCLKEVKAPIEELIELPYDRTMGYGAAEMRLTRLLEQGGG